MRKALISSKSSIIVFAAVAFFLLCAGSTYSKDEKRGISALKYNYVVESDLSLCDFTEAFYDRLKTTHKWNELSRDYCRGNACVSTWKFTDDNANEWKCEVVIEKDELSDNRMLVSMEMIPVLGS